MSIKMSTHLLIDQTIVYLTRLKWEKKPTNVNPSEADVKVFSVCVSKLCEKLQRCNTTACFAPHTLSYFWLLWKVCRISLEIFPRMYKIKQLHTQSSQTSQKGETLQKSLQPTFRPETFFASVVRFSHFPRVDSSITITVLFYFYHQFLDFS